MYFIKMYGRCILEFIDLFKDILYCLVMPHENHVLIYFLWIFTLFGTLFSIFRILIMRKITYKDTFGDEEFQNDDKKSKGKRRATFWALKLRRVIREVFYLQQDREEIEIKVRIARQMAFMAMFKNFPMFFM